MFFPPAPKAHAADISKADSQRVKFLSYLQDPTVVVGGGKDQPTFVQKHFRANFSHPRDQMRNCFIAMEELDLRLPAPSPIQVRMEPWIWSHLEDDLVVFDSALSITRQLDKKGGSHRVASHRICSGACFCESPLTFVLSGHS
jgi:hypothetical protein